MGCEGGSWRSLGQFHDGLPLTSGHSYRAFGFTALPSDYGNHVGEFAQFLKQLRATSYMERLSLRLADGDCTVDPELRVLIDPSSERTKLKTRQLVSPPQVYCWNRTLQGFGFEGKPAVTDFVPAELEKIREALSSAPDYVEEAPIEEPQAPDPNVI